MLKSREILLITLLVIAGFVISDVIVQGLAIFSSLQRFGIRLTIMAQFLALIYLFFDSRDTARRLSRIERRVFPGHEDDTDDNEDIHESHKEEVDSQ